MTALGAKYRFFMVCRHRNLAVISHMQLPAVASASKESPVNASPVAIHFLVTDLVQSYHSTTVRTCVFLNQ